MEPVFTKRAPRPYDNTPFTWEMFLGLRSWAISVVDKVGYPIYLVGSALRKSVPRDIDVSVIIPTDKFIEMFGPFPETQEEFSKYIANVHNNFYDYARYYFGGEESMGTKVTFDFKICPDSWFRDEPKLLLAQPNNNKIFVETTCISA